MEIPQNFIPKGNLDNLVEKALKKNNSYEGLIFASVESVAESGIYVYGASMEEPLQIGTRSSPYIRSFCYDPERNVVYESGDYRTIFNILENKPIEIDGDFLLADHSIFSMVYHRGKIYYASGGRIFKLSNKELVAERKEEFVQSLFIFEDKLCDASSEFMRFTETGEEIAQVPKKLRHVAVCNKIIYDAGEYGIRDAFKKKILKKRESYTLALLPFKNMLLDAGSYCSIWDCFDDKIFLPFDKHITAMASIPLSMVEELREKYGNS